MEKPLKLTGTEDTPDVVLDKENNEFRLSGRSLPEEATAFYKPVIKWMEAYIKDPNPSTEFQINFDYFSSSSVKQVLDILMMLEKLIQAGKKARITWYYDEDDELMEIKGKEFKSMLSVPFEFKKSN